MIASRRLVLRVVIGCVVAGTLATPQVLGERRDPFRQLEEILPTPNATRDASGAPAPGYWQQRADYDIQVELDDAHQRLTGRERVVYHNRSPQRLPYLWMQLDQNLFRKDSDGNLTATAPNFDKLSYRTLRGLLERRSFDGGFTIGGVKADDGSPLPYTVVKTMMRIDLPEPLEPGHEVAFTVDWSYNINDATRIRSRSGYEYFEKDDNYIYEIAQFYPRMAAYTDVHGWQHKQFLGSGEFTLELGDFRLAITVPEDHIVGATGVLQNPEAVLTAAQRERLDKATTASDPVYIVTPAEARKNQRRKARGKKTWVFAADNVRDVAFASSRKFIWDAQLHDVEGNRVLAMSLYPNEGEPLWSRYSTRTIIHTLDVYSRYTFPYPYPVAYSVNGPVGGMEYPMICFNAPRPEEDGTYFDVPQGKARNFWNRSKYGLISVIIHEVGHNYFPMIVNSDERQWTWMDEGLNSFLQFLAEQEWEDDYPSRRGEPQYIVDYMKSTNQVPIMTNSESILQFGNNAYGKPATALNILRQTILGPELFDFAFKEYARRWRFKRPMPADFFRTMEDASGIDLDWFWRGWFYSTDHVDIAIEGVRRYELDSGDPERRREHQRQEIAERPETPTQTYFASVPKRVELQPVLLDFYNHYDSLAVTAEDREKFEELLEDLEPDERELLDTDLLFTVIDFRNVGGLVMPILLDIEYEDGSHEEMRIPAEIWRRNAEQVSKLLLTEKAIRSITLDPHLETADTDRDNNSWPPRVEPSRFKLFKAKKPKNPMQKAKRQEG